MVVTTQSTINSNQQVESVALFDEAGAPVTLGGSAAIDGSSFVTPLSELGTANTIVYMDLSNYSSDTASWYNNDNDMLLLPAGSYSISVQASITGGTLATDKWRMFVTYDGEDYTFEQPVASVVDGAEALVGFRNVVHIFEAAEILVRFSREGIVSAAINGELRIVKL